MCHLLLQNSTARGEILLGTLYSSDQTCLEGEQVLLRAGATMTQQEVCSGGKGDEVVAIRHQTMRHDKEISGTPKGMPAIGIEPIASHL